MVNRVILLGRLGITPKLELLGEKEVPHCKLRLAVERRLPEATVTDWLTVHVWQDLARACAEHVVKGQRLYVEGHLQAGSWTSKDGEHRARLQIMAERVVFLDRPAAAEATEPPPEAEDES
jgi:single-strand DNA-binding protein